MFAFLLLQLALGQDTARFRPLFTFPVTDTTSLRETPLPGGLVVQVRRELDANGTSMGWTVAVYRTPARPESRNLLFESRYFHGPHPADLFAWHHREQYFPDVRDLPVYRYPLELRIACRACTIAGDSTFVHFTSGTVAVAWRRLAQPVLPEE
jgi:hypothetical protein